MNLKNLIKNSVLTTLLVAALMTAPLVAHAAVFVSATVAPPAIPDYTQPPAPADGYIWTPGYWAWTDNGYVWVDGAWVLPPYDGALWTPGYWGFGGDAYFWNAGYWGPVVGYYGGINYGFGYFGIGFYGGYWGGGHFWYNTCYNNIGWHGGHIYNHPYNGYGSRPGGPGFTRTNDNAGNRGSYAGTGHIEEAERRLVGDDHVEVGGEAPLDLLAGPVGRGGRSPSASSRSWATESTSSR